MCKGGTDRFLLNILTDNKHAIFGGTVNVCGVPDLMSPFFTTIHDLRLK